MEENPSVFSATSVCPSRCYILLFSAASKLTEASDVKCGGEFSLWRLFFVRRPRRLLTCEILTGGLLLMKRHRRSTLEPTNPACPSSTCTVCPSIPGPERHTSSAVQCTQKHKWREVEEKKKKQGARWQKTAVELLK